MAEILGQPLLPAVIPSLTLLAMLCAATADMTPPAPAQATVELRLTSVDEGDAKLLEQSLRHQLSDRLLQDGYRLVPDGEPAGVGVWIHLDGTQVRVLARGTGDREQTVAGGDPKVVVLEVLQLTTGLVDEVRPDQTVERAAVALQLAPGIGDPQLREHLQTGLLARGFALTRSPTPTDQRLCVRADGDALAVHTVTGSQECLADAPTTLVPQATALPARALMLLDTAAVSLDQHAQAQSEASATTATEPVPEPVFVPMAVEPRTMAPPATGAPEAANTPPEDAEGSLDNRIPSFTMTGHGGLVGRGGGTDGHFGFRLRTGGRRWLGGGLELTMIPAVASNLRVFEAIPAAVFDWRLPFSKRGLVALAAMGGLHVHHYRQGGSLGDRGTRLGPSVGTTVRLTMLGERGLVAFAGLRAGWSGGRWVHVLSGRSTWRRSAMLIGFEVGLGWDFPWRGRS